MHPTLFERKIKIRVNQLICNCSTYRLDNESNYGVGVVRAL